MSIAPSEYTRDYYLSSCQGHEEFTTTKGRVLPLRLSLPLKIAGLTEGMQVVDIGCGRGEIILQCAQRGSYAWGIDYAFPGLELANEAIQNYTDQEVTKFLGIQQANAVRLPFKNNSTDVVFMLDVVEHLVPDELNQALSEIFRILKPGGKLIIHTMPNLWYYHFGYPIYRFIQRLRGEILPADPRERWTYSHVHVNEQTPRSLKKTLIASGFQTNVWLQSTVSYAYEKNSFVRRGMEILTTAPPLHTIFCNDIFAVGLK
jgi:ubiquinone/menaquinone biosynthesis C-methylase UbiE